MSLFAKNQQLLDKDYVKVWNVIELISNKADPNQRWYEVGQYLGHINIGETFELYHLNQYKQLNLVEAYAQSNIFLELIEKLMSTLFDEDEEIEKLVNTTKWGMYSYYWKKTEVFSSEAFKEIKLFNEYSATNNKEVNSLFDDEIYIDLVIHDNWQGIEISYEEVNSIECIHSFIDSTQPNLDELKVLQEEILIKDTSLVLLDNDLKLARQEIRKLKLEILDQTTLLESELTGLNRFNQLKKDRAGMAKIIAVNFWQEPEHKDTDPIEMAELVRKEMEFYCRKSDLPKTDEALKRIISCVAPENVRRQGRRNKK